MIENIKLNFVGDLNVHESVRLSLLKLPGIEHASVSNNRLCVRYHLPQADAATVVEFIETSDLSLVLSLPQRLSLWLRYYQEAIFLENLNDETGWDSCVREIYVSRYRHRRHGRRDDRPRHWRKYAAPPAHD